MDETKIHPLRLAREKLGITQEVLADLAGLSVPTIKRAERGETLGAFSIAQICTYFSERYRHQVEPKDLGLRRQWESKESASDAQAASETQSHHSSDQTTSILLENLLDNQEFLSKVGQIVFQDILNTASKMFLQSTNRLQYREQPGVILHEDRVVFLESMMSTQWTTYHTSGTDKVIHGLNLFLQEIENVVQIAQGTRWQKRALRLLALGYQLQNCVFRDLSNFTQASIAYQKAFEVAQELDDEELLAASLARQGVVLVQQAKAKQAILYLDNALNIIEKRNLPKLKGYILQALSEANAQEQRMYESWSCLEQIEKIAVSPLEEEQSLVRFHPSSILAQKGIDAVFLKDFKGAIELIDQSLKTYYPTGVKGRARLVALKAEAYYGLGVVDAAALSAKEALTLAQSVGSDKVIVRVKTLFADLQHSQWKEEENVAELGTMLYSASTKTE